MMGDAWAQSPAAAVVPLLSVNLTVEQTDALTSRLAAALTDARRAAVFGGRAIRRRLPESGLPLDCAVSAPCLADVRTRVEAEVLVMVVLTRIGDLIQLDPTIVGLDGSQVRPAVRGTGPQTEDPAWLRAQVAKWLETAPVKVIRVATPVPRHPYSWVPWTLAGVSVASFGVGIGFGIAAQSDASRLESNGCLETRCPDDEIDQVSSQATVADVMFVVGAVTAATAVVTYFVFEDPPPVTVGVGPGGVGLRARF